MSTLRLLFIRNCWKRTIMYLWLCYVGIKGIPHISEYRINLYHKEVSSLCVTVKIQPNAVECSVQNNPSNEMKMCRHKTSQAWLSRKFRFVVKITACIINCMPEGVHCWFHGMFFTLFSEKSETRGEKFRNTYSSFSPSPACVSDVRFPGSFHLVFVCFPNNGRLWRCGVGYQSAEMWSAVWVLLWQTEDRNRESSSPYSFR